MARPSGGARVTMITSNPISGAGERNASQLFACYSSKKTAPGTRTRAAALGQVRGRAAHPPSAGINRLAASATESAAIIMRISERGGEGGGAPKWLRAVPGAGRLHQASERGQVKRADQNCRETGRRAREHRKIQFRRAGTSCSESSGCLASRVESKTARSQVAAAAAAAS